MSMPSPKLTLVGAGPGDPELLTLKGVKALASADVVLYDALVDEKLLEYAKGAIKIFVGKRKGFQEYSQEEINDLIIKYAFSKGHVVRLKGGDSFVFGRGAEEIDSTSRLGIEVDIVPGISSATSVPASQGIPLTQRNVAQSFWVITGTTKRSEISADLNLAMKSTATIVILMGMSKLDEIVQLFQEENRGDMPIAVIQNGTMENEKMACGVIDSILKEVIRRKVSTPAIIVIGEVVRQSFKLKGLYKQISYLEIA